MAIINSINVIGGACGQVRYLRDDLKKEYDRVSIQCPEIPSLTSPMINVSDVLKAYFILADYFTDPSSHEEVEHMLVGLRSFDLLASALGRQEVSFAGRAKYTNPIDICSTLFFGLVKNHAFSDGNKRTALLILLYQLNLYGWIPAATVEKFEELVISVAANQLPEDHPEVWDRFKGHSQDDRIIAVISYQIKRMVSKKDNSYHVNMTAKEFCSALDEMGVNCTIAKGKIRFHYKPHGDWAIFCQEKNYSIPFGGWTRIIGPQTARDLLQHLGLYTQISSYQGFLAGESPMYQLIQQFEVPLRRLKDE